MVKTTVVSYRTHPLRLPPTEVRAAFYDALDYDPETGEIRWAESRRRVSQGDLAGSISTDGAVVIRFMGRVYQAAHIAWFLETDDWPESPVKFLDNNPMNLRFSNLAPQQRVYADKSQAEYMRGYRAKQKAARKAVRPKSYLENVFCSMEGVWTVYAHWDHRIILASFHTKQEAEDYAEATIYGRRYAHLNRPALFSDTIGAIPAGGRGALSLQDASNRFAYDPDTGMIFRRKTAARVDREGTPTVEIDDTGRPVVRASGRTYTAGMMAWFLHTGDWPGRKQLAYRDKDPKNIKFANLYLRKEADP